MDDGGPELTAHNVEEFDGDELRRRAYEREAAAHRVRRRHSSERSLRIVLAAHNMGAPEPDRPNAYCEMVERLDDRLEAFFKWLTEERMQCILAAARAGVLADALDDAMRDFSAPQANSAPGTPR
jgi:hypothetical protein